MITKFCDETGKAFKPGKDEERIFQEMEALAKSVYELLKLNKKAENTDEKSFIVGFMNGFQAGIGVVKRAEEMKKARKSKAVAKGSDARKN